MDTQQGSGAQALLDRLAELGLRVYGWDGDFDVIDGDGLAVYAPDEPISEEARSWYRHETAEEGAAIRAFEVWYAARVREEELPAHAVRYAYSSPVACDGCGEATQEGILDILEQITRCLSCWEGRTKNSEGTR